MKHYTLYIKRIVLLVLLQGVSALQAWADGAISHRIDTTDVPIRYTTEEYIYAVPGQEGSITLQEWKVDDNIDGYIRWFTHYQDKEGVEGISRNEDLYEGKDTVSKAQLTAYVNGYAWNTDLSLSQQQTTSNHVNVIKYRFTEEQIQNGIVVVCDASSVQAEERTEAEGIKTLRPRVVSIRHRYIVKPAAERYNALKASNEAFNLIVTDKADISSLLTDPNRSNCFLHEYDIHTPVGSETNYRLPERISNYFLTANQAATKLRWHFYNEQGHKVGDVKKTDKPLCTHSFASYLDPTQQHERYIMVEVGDGNNMWMPVSLLHVVLEPYSEPLTEKELEQAYQKAPVHYQDRMLDMLVDNHSIRQVESLSMERQEDRIAWSQVTPQMNFVKDPANMTSYYAFAEPAMAEFRDNNHKLSVGRGEYALYRTLNYPEISKVGDNYLFEGTFGSYNAHYNDWFASASNGYPVRVVDRLCEKTNGEQSGYFMYIDAADEPSVIAKIDLGADLCEHTSLIVSAWVCDLRTSMGSDWTSADIGFTFKKKDRVGTEKILSKFYTGSFPRKPENGGEGVQAQWQQVSFAFSIPEALKSGETYLLEIANNCAHSVGADYAIDDIQVFVSTPNIRVQRANACESSVLEVRSDYNTLRRNMGWDVDPDVLSKIDEKYDDVSFRRFRYGLMGTSPALPAPKDVTDSLYRYLGNLYFGFIEDPTKTGQHPGDWVTVNKAAAAAIGNNEPAAAAFTKSIRVAVPTNADLSENAGTRGINYIPSTMQEALDREYKLNVRAMNNFLNDVEQGMWQQTGLDGKQGITTESDLYKKLKVAFDQLWDNTKKDADVNKIKENYNVYNTHVAQMFGYLGIPRIRCPWKDDTGTILYLDAIDVYNTDLKFKGEKGLGDTEPAKGEYWVVLFNALDIANIETGQIEQSIDVTDPCTLKSMFYVIPSEIITIDTETSPRDNVTCVGTIHTVSAQLMEAAVDELGNVLGESMKPMSSEDYTYDWFLGSMEEYQQQTVGEKSLQLILAELRESFEDPLAPITLKGIESSNLPEDKKRLLKALMGEGYVTKPRLLSGKEKVEFIWVEKVVAIPYVIDGETDNMEYCVDPQEIPLAGQLDVPGLAVGFTDITTYPDDAESKKLFNAPLRLGLRHIRSEEPLPAIPIRGNDITFGTDEGNSLQMIDGKREIKMILPSGALETVATLKSLYVGKDEQDYSRNALSLSFKQETADHFEEGKTYKLYIPYGEYDAKGSLLTDACEGLAELEIKIVPEYLTWTGNGEALWYHDENWQQSTQAELYMGNEETDANGTDPIANAFAPLYFTKITIDPAKKEGTDQLTLQDESELQDGDAHNTLQFDEGWDVTPNIQYDMAVDTVKGDNAPLQVVPYYGNKVSEIYFKPGATLMQQQWLDYDTARVEFLMKKSRPYWMASPLQAVYAGDLYAPTAGGEQNTPAFEPIFYNSVINSRWNPAFYQKAWNRAVEYATNSEGSEKVDVAAVKSNWSIEYNDVRVPYTLGKGFYARVEGQNVRVRLPKADESYGYEAAPTRAAVNDMSTLADRTGAGQLAAYNSPDGTVSVKLTDLFGESAADVAEGEKRHFLVGNPYMTHLNMAEFLRKNNNLLAPKYWVLTEAGAPDAVVGTPDVGWICESTDGTVAPMQAFFVELVEGATVDTDAEISFTPDMMSASVIAEGGATTKGATATHPVITITAEQGEAKSRATLIAADCADNGYKADEDAVVLLDSELDVPMAYTVAGNRAAQVNAVKRIDNIPLGVYNRGKDEVAVTIEGIAQLATPLYLYDAHTRTSTLLEGDRYALTLSGDSHGRYYLRSRAVGNEAEGIRIYSVQPGEVMVSAVEPLRSIRVYSPAGTQLRHYSRLSAPECRFRLPAGVYVVYVEGEKGAKSEKIVVRP